MRIYKYLILVNILFIPAITIGCSVCGGSFTDEELTAYTIITILLGLIPVLAFVFLFLWIYKKYRNV